MRVFNPSEYKMKYSKELHDRLRIKSDREYPPSKLTNFEELACVLNEVDSLKEILISFKEGFENDVFGVLPNGNGAQGYDEGIVRGGEYLTSLMEKIKQAEE